MKPTVRIAIPISFLYIFSGCIFSGCINDRFGSSGTPDPDSPISFDGTVKNPSVNASDTRATGSSWQPEDEIGVYMVTSGGAIARHSLSVNAMHLHAGNGNFTAGPGHELFFPRVGRVDFVAYYPWRPTYSDHRYPVDVSDQSDPAAIDILYSDNAVGHTSGDVPLLEFHHKLSKLVFNVSDSTGASLDGLEAVIGGLSTRTVFDLSEGGLDGRPDRVAGIAPVPVDDTDDKETTARLEAIVIPEEEIAPSVVFDLPDGTAARLNLLDESYESGNVYIYNVTVTAPGRVVLTGGTVIVDWDDEDRDPGRYFIPKIDPGGPDNPGEPQNTKVQYFVETFGGDSNLPADPVKITDYAGWNETSVRYGERFGGADVRRAGSLDAHIYFPPGADADFRIEGLPTGYMEITLSYDITAVDQGGVGARVIRIYAGPENLSTQVTAIIPSPNRYTTVTIDVPDRTASLRFVSDATINTHGMRIDNIRLKGVKDK